MKSNFVPLYKKNVFSCLLHPLFFISAAVFEISCSLQFFVFQQFFVQGTGTSDLHRFFSAIPYICIFIIPSLTVKNGTDTFDDTLPVSSVNLSAAAWLSSFTEFLIMLLPLVLVPVCVSFYGNVDGGQVAAGFAGILFYAAAAISFSLFAAECIPGASYIISTAALAVTGFAHIIPLYIALPEPAVRLLHICSFTWHFEAADKGILDTRDIIFYAGLTILFFIAAACRNESRKGRRHCIRKELPLILCITLCILNGYRYYLRIDLTKQKEFTVSDISLQVLSRADNPVRITYYRSGSLAGLYPQVQDIYDFLTAYADCSRHMSVQLNDPSKEKAATLLDSYGIIPQQLGSESAYSAIVIEYLGMRETIPFILSTETLEYDLTVRLQHLIDHRVRTAYLLCGNSLSVQNDYHYAVSWLETQQFSVSAITPAELSGLQPRTDTVLAVFGSAALTELDASYLESYIVNGGKTLFAVSPFTVDINGSWSVKERADDPVISLLTACGIRFGSQLISDTNCSDLQLYSDNSPVKTVKYPFWISVLPQENIPKGMLLYWASPLFFYDKTPVPIIRTSSQSMLVDKNPSGSSLFETNPLVFSDTDKTGTSAGSYTAGALFSGTYTGRYTGRTGTARIIIVSDQFFAADRLIQYIPDNGAVKNLDMLSSLLLRLNGDSGLADLQNRNSSYYELYKMRDTALRSVYRIRILALFLICIPAAYVLSAVCIIILRKKSKLYTRV